MSSQISVSSASIFCRYSLMRATWPELPFDSSFCSMEVTILQEARRAPMTFLYATDRRFRSSTVRSQSSLATIFMFSTISVAGAAASARAHTPKRGLGCRQPARGPYLRTAQPARRAWPGKQHLRDPFWW